VSHDRVFMDKVANKVLEIHNGLIRHYPGNFTDYMHAKEREMAEGLVDSAPFLVSDGKILFSGSLASPKQPEQKAGQGKKSKEEKRLEAQRRNELSKKRRPPEQDIKKLEISILHIEARLAEIEALLQKPEVYTDGIRCSELLAEKKELHTRLEKDMAQWEEKNSELREILGEFEKNMD